MAVNVIASITDKAEEFWKGTQSLKGPLSVGMG